MALIILSIRMFDSVWGCHKHTSDFECIAGHLGTGTPERGGAQGGIAPLAQVGIAPLAQVGIAPLAL
jgi:hypothetical protein